MSHRPWDHGNSPTLTTFRGQALSTPPPLHRDTPKAVLQPQSLTASQSACLPAHGLTPSTDNSAWTKNSNLQRSSWRLPGAATYQPDSWRLAIYGYARFCARYRFQDSAPPENRWSLRTTEDQAEALIAPRALIMLKVVMHRLGSDTQHPAAAHGGSALKPPYLVKKD